MLTLYQPHVGVVAGRLSVDKGMFFNLIGVVEGWESTNKSWCEGEDWKR